MQTSQIGSAEAGPTSSSASGSGRKAKGSADPAACIIMLSDIPNNAQKGLTAGQQGWRNFCRSSRCLNRAPSFDPRQLLAEERMPTHPTCDREASETVSQHHCSAAAPNLFPSKHMLRSRTPLPPLSFCLRQISMPFASWDTTSDHTKLFSKDKVKTCPPAAHKHLSRIQQDQQLKSALERALVLS